MKRISSLLGRFLKQRDPDGTRYHLARLWRHWSEVVGDEAAGARPLGHRGTTLLLGAADHMAAQELMMRAPGILDRANAFLGMNFFDKVHVDLLRNHASPGTPGPQGTHGPGKPR